MNVEATMFRSLQHRHGQQQSVGGHNRYIGIQRGEIGLNLRIFQRFGMADRNVAHFGLKLDGRRLQLFATSGPARRLRIDRKDFVPRLMQGGQRRHRECGCAHEDDAHKPVRSLL